MAAATAESKGVFGDVVDSIFTPGTNAGLIKAMSYSFYALFVTLATLVYATDFNLHVCFLLLLSIALFGSIKWFLVLIAPAEEVYKREFEKKEREQREKKQAEGRLKQQ